MLKIRKAGLLEISKVYRLCNKLKYDKEFLKVLNFYDEYDGCLFLQIVLRNVYFVTENGIELGIIVFDRTNDRLYYLPSGNNITLYNLMEVIKQNLFCSGASMTLKYKNIDIEEVKKNFSVEILDNLMYMRCDRDKFHEDIIIENNALLVRTLQVNKEENLRIEMQNDIFSNIKNRTPLTLNDILYEEASSKFLKDYCFILEEYRNPAGYGQILKINNGYFLVNFGIIEKYRKNGYGYYFLYQIMRTCFYDGIKVIYLSVDKKNDAAIKLYKNIGFEEIYNSITFGLN